MVVEVMDNMEAMVTKLGRNKLDSDSKHDTSTDMICVNKDDGTEDVFGVDSEAMSEKEPKKASSVSIDVTKALVILGFSNWSDLDDQETGKDTDVNAEDRLKEVLEEKIRERHEYRKILEQFRYSNTELFQKMSQAGEARNNALCNKKAKWKLAVVLPQDNNAKSPKATPLHKTQQGKSKNKPEKEKAVKEIKEPKISSEKIDEILDENDEVVQSLKWAHETLLKEYNQRKQIRTNRGSIKRKAGRQIKSMWAFKHMNDAKKKAKAEKTKEDGIYNNMKSNNEDKVEETAPLVDDIIKPLTPSIDQHSDDDTPKLERSTSKPKTLIINLQRKLSFRRKEGKASSSNSKSNKWVEKTEEQKILEAQQHLKWLQEKQKQNIIVDFFGVPTKKEPIKVIINDEEPAIESSSNPENSIATSEVPAITSDVTNKVVSKDRNSDSARPKINNKKPASSSMNNKIDTLSVSNKSATKIDMISASNFSSPRITTPRNNIKKSSTITSKDRSSDLKKEIFTPQPVRRRAAPIKRQMTVGVVPKGMKKLGKSIEQNTNKNAINCNRLEIKEKDEPAAINLEELEKSKEEKEEEDRYKKELFKLQVEQQNKAKKELEEAERLYAEQKRIEDEKRKKREEQMKNILELNFDEEETDNEDDSLMEDDDRMILQMMENDFESEEEDEEEEPEYSETS